LVGLEYNADEILGGEICNKTFREFVIVSELLKKKFCIIGIVLLTMEIYNGNRWILISSVGLMLILQREEMDLL